MTDLFSLSRAAADVMTERQRQIEAEGWTPEHDDQHKTGELAEAGACYAHTASIWAYMAYQESLPEDDRDIDLDEVPPTERWIAPEGDDESMDLRWPWDPKWWKPCGGGRRMLVKAGALILAEIERLDRVATKTPQACAHGELLTDGCSDCNDPQA